MVDAIAAERIVEVKADVAQAIERVAAFYRVGSSDLLGRRDHGRVALARQVGIWVLARRFGKSAQWAGWPFGCDHGKAHHAILKVNGRAAIDQGFHAVLLYLGSDTPLPEPIGERLDPTALRWCRGEIDRTDLSGIGRHEDVDPFSPLEQDLFRARMGLPFAAVQLLDAMGVPLEFVGVMAGAGAIGRVRATISRGGLWQEAEDGEGRLVLAVREQGALIDLVALSSTDPDSWALRTGAGVLLGHDRWLSAVIGQVDRLRVFGNPVAWMRQRGAGICVLDWSRDALSALRALGPGVTLDCDDAAARDALHGMLRWGGLPQVAVGEDELGREAA